MGIHSKECSINTEVIQGFILGFVLFQLHINDRPGDAICNIAIYFDDATLFSI